MYFENLIKKIGQKNKQPKEDLYTRILLWANDKQESGFSWEEMRAHFNLNHSQDVWVQKIFFTASDSDRKFFEILKNDSSTSSNVYFYSLNEKGITAALNYKGLQHAEKNSSHALWFAGLSVLLTVFGLFFSARALYYAKEQTRLTGIQSISEQINQARITGESIKFCKENPTAQDSGLYIISTGKTASCEVVNKKYREEPVVK